MHRYRSHTCGDLSTEHVGLHVRLSGWLHNRRDHGGLLCINLRDHYVSPSLSSEPNRHVADRVRLGILLPLACDVEDPPEFLIPFVAELPKPTDRAVAVECVMWHSGWNRSEAQILIEDPSVRPPTALQFCSCDVLRP